MSGKPVLGGHRPKGKIVQQPAGKSGPVIKPMSKLDIKNAWTDDIVACDDGCGAKAYPVTTDELLAAYEHWKYHGYLSGCSHAC